MQLEARARLEHVVDYVIIFDEGVWLVIETKLPTLLAEVRELLAEP